MKRWAIFDNDLSGQWRRVWLGRSLMLSACLAVVLTIGAGAPTTAIAQQKIEQMIVTATKRALDVQQVPASISAFAADTLRERQVRSITELTAATPNLSLGLAGGNAPILSIRGVSADPGNLLGDGTVALHIDGIYQPRVMGLPLFMSDLETVEVLRGPQGTVYGRNANAGVINLITAKPTDSFEGSATIFGGSYDRYGARGYISGPVMDGVSMRLSAMVDRNKGWAKNLYNGHDIGAEWQHGARVAVRLQPREDVTVDLSAAYVQHRSSMPMFLGAGAPLEGPGFNYTALKNMGFDVRYTQEPWKVYNTFDPEETTRVAMTAGIIKWDITTDISLKSLTGYQFVNTRFIQDSDTMPVNYSYNPFSSNSHTFSQEFNLNAKLFERLDAVAGLYYMDDRIFGGNQTPIFYGSNVAAGTTNGLLLVNILDTVAISRAAFLDLTFNVTDDLRLLAGIRRTFDTKSSVSQLQTRINTINGNPLTGTKIDACGPNHIMPQLRYTSTTGKIGLQYDFTPDITGYIQWQDGFKTGGYNYSRCDNSFLPERIYSWEGGVKSRLFNDTVSLNVSLFQYKYSNMQLSRTVFFGAGFATIIDNASTATIKGGEVEFAANLTDDLSMNIGIGFLDGKYGSPLAAANGVVPGSPVVSYGGNKIPRTPDVTINAGLEYTMRLGDLGELKSRGEYSYQAMSYYTSFDEAISKQDGYSLWNAYFTFKPDNCDLTFQVYGKNLTDKAYTTGGNTSSLLFFSRVSYAPPRTFGAEVTAKF